MLTYISLLVYILITFLIQKLGESALDIACSFKDTFSIVEMLLERIQAVDVCALFSSFIFMLILYF